MKSAKSCAKSCAKSLLIGFLVLQFATVPTFADETVDPTLPPVTINPETLRQWVISSNLGIVEELNRVHAAKEKVNVDYANLLPSLNLGSIVQGKSGVILSSITFLLPFLMPSNWIAVRTDKSLFESEKISYRILQLNSYNSALITYYTILANQTLLAIYIQQERNLASIAAIISEAVKTGMTTKRDALVAQAQTLTAHEQVLKTREMIEGEIVSLKQAMDLPISAELKLESSTVGETPAEAGTVQNAIDRADAAAPELVQLGLISLAANHAKWSAVFSFIQNPSLSSISVPNHDGQYANASLSRLTPRASLNFSFAAFPSYELAQTDADLIRIQIKEAELANQTVVATAYEGLGEAKERLNTALSAERKFREVYAVDLQRYKIGTLSLTDLLIDQTSLSNASLMHVESVLDMNLERTILNRALLTDTFSGIPGCASDAVAKSQTDAGRFLRSIFGGKKDRITLDQLCHIPG